MTTHDELVRRAARWLANTRGCGVVLTETRYYGYEEPDAIGWRVADRWSILVECKASRADFLRDQKKVARRSGDLLGIGQERWYMAPPGLLTADDLPAGWGLLEVGRCVRRIVDAEHYLDTSAPRSRPDAGEIRGREQAILLSMLRRHHCRECFRSLASG